MRNLHPFHLVDASPWPALMALSVLVTALGLIMSFHRYPNALGVLSVGFMLVLYVFFVWWRDVSRESTIYHTNRVQTGIEWGMMLFITSEAAFFFGLLWAFVHLASQPTVSLGTQWPPEGIIPVDWTRRPLLNTALLFTSYFSANLARYAVEVNNLSMAATQLVITIVLGALFTFYQWLEYTGASFTMSDSAFGSVFYLSTGFHGFHVIVGVLYLTVCLLLIKQTTPSHSLGVRLAVLYWHFVDIVWIALMVIIYYWGSYIRPV
jgi:cytochrome c oxidase subunit 3